MKGGVDCWEESMAEGLLILPNNRKPAKFLPPPPPQPQGKRTRYRAWLQSQQFGQISSLFVCCRDDLKMFPRHSLIRIQGGFRAHKFSAAFWRGHETPFSGKKGDFLDRERQIMTWRSYWMIGLYCLVVQHFMDALVIINLWTLFCFSEIPQKKNRRGGIGPALCRSSGEQDVSRCSKLDSSPLGVKVAEESRCCKQKWLYLQPPSFEKVQHKTENGHIVTRHMQCRRLFACNKASGPL